MVHFTFIDLKKNMEIEEKKKYSSKFHIKGICMNSENFEKISKITLKAIKENKFEKDIASQIKIKCESDELLNKDCALYNYSNGDNDDIDEPVNEKENDQENTVENTSDNTNIDTKENIKETTNRSIINSTNNLKHHNIGSWQCVVGKNFAFSINYQFNCMIYFQHKISKLTILIYKSL